MTLYDVACIMTKMLTPVMTLWHDVDPCNDPYLQFLGAPLLGGLDNGLELFHSEGEVSDPLDHSDTLGYCVSSPRLRDNTYNPTIHTLHTCINTEVLENHVNHLKQESKTTDKKRDTLD